MDKGTNWITMKSRLRRGSVGIALAVGLALSMGACGEQTTSPDDVSLVEWTSSFGFCPPTSYCTTRLRVNGRQAVVTLESRESGNVTTSRMLSTDEADALVRAAARVRFEGVGPVLGCPDCADGGAETLSVTAAGKISTVTFEYNTQVAQLEPLLGQMRELVSAIRPIP